MSNTISQWGLGTEIQVYENGSPVPYVILKKDSIGTVLLRALCSESRRMNPTNVSVYTGSEMDTYLSDETNGFVSRFDTNTKSALVMRSIPTYSHGDTECSYISRKCYLLSQGDMLGNTATALEPEASSVAALMIWKGKANPNAARITYTDAAPSSEVYWWLRSPRSAANFFTVHVNGTSDGNNATFSCGVRPALNVSNDTIVTVGDDNKIYLTPALTERYSVEFKTKVVEEAVRPSKARVTFNSQGLSNLSVKVCNNYGDINPTWVDATSQQQVTIPNASKETEKWQVGIWFYGDTTTSGYVDEPEINYLMEG